MNAPDLFTPAVEAAPPDPKDPLVWWRMLVDAVIAYKNGDHEPGNAYIRFTREHRGKEQAKKVAETIVRNAAASSWADCHLWPAWGYKTKDPTPVAEKYQKGRKRK